MNNPCLSDVSAMCIDGLEDEGFILSGEKADVLEGTSCINVLIGENSAGKPPVSGLLSPLNYLKLSGANKVNNGLFHRTKRGNTQETIATC